MSFTVTKDTYYNNLYTTNNLKIPKYKNLAQLGDQPGLEGNVILDKSTGEFCWHDGVSWQCVSAGGGGGCQVITVVSDAGTANSQNCQLEILGGAGVNTSAVGNSIIIDSTGMQTNLSGVGCSPPLSPSNEANLVLNGVGPNLEIRNLSSTFGLIFDPQPSGCLDIRVDPDIVGLTNLTGVGCSPPLSPTNEANLVLSGVGPNLEIRNLSSTFGLIFDPQPSGCLDIRVDPDIVGLTNLTGVGCSPPLSPDNQTNLVLSGVGPNLEIRNLSSTFGLIFDEQPDGCVDITVDPDLFGAENIGFGADVGPQNDRFIVYNGQPNLPDTLPLQIRTLYGSQNQAVTGLEAEDVIVNDTVTNSTPEIDGNVIGTSIVQTLTINVSTGGNDLNDGITAPVQTLARAIEIARFRNYVDQCIIDVEAGTFATTENILNLKLAARGRQRSPLLIRGQLEQVEQGIIPPGTFFPGQNTGTFSAININNFPQSYDGYTIELTYALGTGGTATRRYIMTDISPTSYLVSANIFIEDIDTTQVVSFTIYRRATIFTILENTFVQGDNSYVIFKDVQFLLGDANNSVNLQFDNCSLIFNNTEFLQNGILEQDIRFLECVCSSFINPNGVNPYTGDTGSSPAIPNIPITEGPAGVCFNLSRVQNVNGFFIHTHSVFTTPPNTRSINVELITNISVFLICIFSGRNLTETDPNASLTRVINLVGSFVQIAISTFVSLAEFIDCTGVSGVFMFVSYYQATTQFLSGNYDELCLVDFQGTMFCENVEYDCSNLSMNLLNTSGTDIVLFGTVFRNVVSKQTSFAIDCRQTNLTIIVDDQNFIQDITTFDTPVFNLLECNIEISSIFEPNQGNTLTLIDNLVTPARQTRVYFIHSSKVMFNGYVNTSQAPLQYLSFIDSTAVPWALIDQQILMINSEFYCKDVLINSNNGTPQGHTNFIQAENSVVTVENGTNFENFGPGPNALFVSIFNLLNSQAVIRLGNYNGLNLVDPVQNGLYLTTNVNSQVYLRNFNANNFGDAVVSDINGKIWAQDVNIGSAQINGSVGYFLRGTCAQLRGCNISVENSAIDCQVGSTVNVDADFITMQNTSNSSSLIYVDSSVFRMTSAILRSDYGFVEARNNSKITAIGCEIQSTNGIVNPILILDNKCEGIWDNIFTAIPIFNTALAVTRNSKLTMTDSNINVPQPYPPFTFNSFVQVYDNSEFLMSNGSILGHSVRGVDVRNGSTATFRDSQLVEGRGIQQYTECSIFASNSDIVITSTNPNHNMTIGQNIAAGPNTFSAGIILANSNLLIDTELTLNENTTAGIYSTVQNPADAVYGNSTIKYLNLIDESQSPPVSKNLKIFNSQFGLDLENCVIDFVNCGIDLRFITQVAMTLKNCRASIPRFTMNDNLVLLPSGIQMVTSTAVIDNFIGRFISDIFFDLDTSNLTIINPFNLTFSTPCTHVIRAVASTVNYLLDRTGFGVTANCPTPFILDKSTLNIIYDPPFTMFPPDPFTIVDYTDEAINATDSTVNLKNVDLRGLTTGTAIFGINANRSNISVVCDNIQNVGLRFTRHDTCFNMIQSKFTLQGQPTGNINGRILFDLLGQINNNAISLSNSSESVVNFCDISNINQTGIICNNTKLTCLQTILANNTRGFDITNSSEVVATICSFSNHSNTVITVDNSKLTCTNCTVNQNLQGMIITNSSEVVVTDGSVSDNTLEGIVVNINSKLTCRDVTITDNAQGGILVQRGSRVYYSEPDAANNINNGPYGFNIQSNSAVVAQYPTPGNPPTLSGVDEIILAAVGAISYPAQNNSDSDYALTPTQLCNITCV